MQTTVYASILIASLGLGAARAQSSHDSHHARPTVPQATEAGQSAFAAIAEVVTILRTDPGTDWNSVDLEALRQHLIDMDDTLLRSHIAVRQLLEDGIRLEIVADGRARGAVQRMITAHAASLDGYNGSWQATSSKTPNGASLEVKSEIGDQARIIQALGFSGILATGAHHQQHHLAIARGQPMH